jgi:hypothetical protein
MKKRGVYQRRQKNMGLAGAKSQSLSDGVTHQLYAKPKPQKAAPKKFHAEAPAARPVGGGMSNL